MVLACKSCGRLREDVIFVPGRGYCVDCYKIVKAEQQKRRRRRPYSSWLTPIGKVRRQNKSYWTCLCKCGAIKEILASNLRWTKSCGCYIADSVGSNNAAWRGCGDLSGQRWNGIRQSAISRGIEWDISVSQAWDLFVNQDGKCALSGLVLKFSAPGANASLDRVDSNLGYSIGNVQWVHVELNRMKGSLLQAEFITWCERVVEFARNNSKQ